MTIPVASPARVSVPVGMASPPTPPPPTYAGHFALLNTQSADAADKKRILWEYCVQVLEFLSEEIQPRIIAKMGYGNEQVRQISKDLSDARTALIFSLSGSYQASRDYREGFEYVERGKADDMMDVALRLYDDEPVPMPNARADPSEFADWAHFHPLPTFGARRRRRAHKTRRHRRNRKNKTRRV